MCPPPLHILRGKFWSQYWVMELLMESAWTGQEREKYTSLDCSVTVSALLCLQSPSLLEHSLAANPLPTSMHNLCCQSFSPQRSGSGNSSQPSGRAQTNRVQRHPSQVHAHFFHVQLNLSTVVSTFVVKGIRRACLWVMTGHGCAAFYVKKKYA